MRNARRCVDASIIALWGMGIGVAFAGATDMAIFLIGSGLLLAIVRLLDKGD